MGEQETKQHGTSPSNNMLQGEGVCEKQRTPQLASVQPGTAAGEWQGATAAPPGPAGLSSGAHPLRLPAPCLVMPDPEASKICGYGRQFVRGLHWGEDCSLRDPCFCAVGRRCADTAPLHRGLRAGPAAGGFGSGILPGPATPHMTGPARARLFSHGGCCLGSGVVILPRNLNLRPADHFWRRVSLGLRLAPWPGPALTSKSQWQAPCVVSALLCRSAA
jgi:hypothetical protein